MISSRKLLLTGFWLLLLALAAESQLTFSTDWGKRSGGSAGSSLSGNGNGVFFDSQLGNCKTSNEILLEIFQFVQTQSQLFLDCKHRDK